MAGEFKVGEHVAWNYEGGRTRGVIRKIVRREILFKGHTVHASKEEPQYLIASETTEHMAMHKGGALRRVGKRKAGG